MVNNKDNYLNEKVNNFEIVQSNPGLFKEKMKESKKMIKLSSGC